MTGWQTCEVKVLIAGIFAFIVIYLDRLRAPGENPEQPSALPTVRSGKRMPYKNLIN